MLVVYTAAKANMFDLRQPPLLSKYTYWLRPRTKIVRAMHGDASGVRGAAMLWPA